MRNRDAISNEMVPVSSPEMPRAAQSVVTTVSYPRWGVLGKRFGPEESIKVRVHLVSESLYRYERVDGKALGDLVTVCRPQLAEAEEALSSIFRESRLRILRSAQQRAFEAAPTQAVQQPAADADELPPSDCTGCERRADVKTSSAIFRCDREQITDRITRLRSKPVADPTPSATTALVPAPVQPQNGHELNDDQRKALAEMNALRERRWRESRAHPTDLDLTPSKAVAADGTTTPEKRTSSVFRCDREVITDRISRLRTNPADGKDAPSTEAPTDSIEGGSVTPAPG